MEIKLTSVADAESLSEFYRKNAAHLRAWEPLREEGYHSVEAWAQRLVRRETEQSIGTSAYFVAYSANGSRVIATCSLTNIARGVFQGCNIGYSICEELQGRGLMRALCVHVIDYGFQDLGLNRIMANYMPSNRRSENLLSRLGFSKEGLAKKYLLINGRWEDHVLTSLLNPGNT